jgi:hypothetical protein
MANENGGGRSGVLRFAAIAAFAAAGAAGAMIGYQKYGEIQKDDDAFALARGGGSPEHFVGYLQQFPQGRHAEEASKAVDDAVWRDTPPTVGGLSAYLERLPNGRHATEARVKLDDLAWAEATKKGGIAGFDAYLRQFPAGQYVSDAENRVAAKLACNRKYAQNELANLTGNSALVAAGTEGASNIYSTKQGTPRSDTYFNGNTATTYYHDGSYQSQDGIRVDYRVRNNSQFLLYREVDGTVSFRTKAGAFWRGVVGGWIGAAVGGAKDGDATQGMKDGAKKGYDMAQHSERVTISSPLAPGDTYKGSAFLSAKYKVLNSDFKINTIRAEISESLLRRRIAPGC